MNLPGRVLGLLMLVSVLVGCSGDKPLRLHADLDLYLHPQASGPDEIILQAAILRRLRAQRLNAVHVRVVDHLILLSGAVESERDKEDAARIAGETTVKIDETTLPSARLSIRNDLVVEK